MICYQSKIEICQAHVLMAGYFLLELDLNKSVRMK